MLMDLVRLGEVIVMVTIASGTAGEIVPINVTAVPTVELTRSGKSEIVVPSFATTISSEEAAGAWVPSPFQTTDTL